jgi:hypothetical protein
MVPCRHTNNTPIEPKSDMQKGTHSATITTALQEIHKTNSQNARVHHKTVQKYYVCKSAVITTALQEIHETKSPNARIQPNCQIKNGVPYAGEIDSIHQQNHKPLLNDLIVTTSNCKTNFPPT